LSIKRFLVAIAVVCAVSLPVWLPHTCDVQWALVGSDERRLIALKNRETPPNETDFDRRVTLEALLMRGPDQSRWSDERAAVIEGYVVRVQSGAIEFANCLSLSERDIHIDVAREQRASATERVVVEVTPHWRRRAREDGLDWSLEALSRLVGKRVRMEGWLLFDTEHQDESENTKPGVLHNWRATAWELHPVTGIRVVE
jgi:hypothetical protein